jgi:hypothetical protein
LPRHSVIALTIIFCCGSLCGMAGPRQRTGCGWQAKPILEQTGASPAAPREQFTHSSVHRLQFGGPWCTEMSPGAVRGGISRSAANAARRRGRPPLRQRWSKLKTAYRLSALRHRIEVLFTTSQQGRFKSGHEGFRRAQIERGRQLRRPPREKSRSAGAVPFLDILNRLFVGVLLGRTPTVTPVSFFRFRYGAVPRPQALLSLTDFK